MERTDSSELICGACCEEIGVGEEYLQCMVQACRKLFHYLCTNKKLTLEERDKWVCPECCIAHKRVGRNCDTPVCTPVSVKNVASRIKSDASDGAPPPLCDVSRMSVEMKHLREHIALLTEQLAGAVSTITRYQTALDDCTQKLEVVSQKLIGLEQVSVCRCQCGAVLGSAQATVPKKIPTPKSRQRKNRQRRVSDAGETKQHEATPVVSQDVPAGESDVPPTGLDAGDHSGTSEEGWRTVARRRSQRRFSSVRCTAGPNVTSLKAVEQRKFIHLWNMISEEHEIYAYLQTLCPGKTCTVEELKPRGDYKSFKIGVPPELFDKCLSPDCWPDNARVRTWFFRRAQRTQKPENEKTD